jgi:hypothetical protein
VYFITLEHPARSYGLLEPACVVRLLLGGEIQVTSQLEQSRFSKSKTMAWEAGSPSNTVVVARGAGQGLPKQGRGPKINTKGDLGQHSQVGANAGAEILRAKAKRQVPGAKPTALPFFPLLCR